MMRALALIALTGAIALGCSDAGGVDPDAIDGQEKAAVQIAINRALANDTLYPTLSQLVFPYIDRASRLPAGGDTTRLVGVELDIKATQAGDSVNADFTVILAWRGYRAATRTVDSVFFILGAGRAPANDSLRTRFSADTAGTGTGFVIHQRPDSSVDVWLARTGRLVTTASSYGARRTQRGGGIVLTTTRGTLAGNYHLTAKLVPDSSTTVSSLADFGSGGRGLKVEIRGDLP